MISSSHSPATTRPRELLVRSHAGPAHRFRELGYSIASGLISESELCRNNTPSSPVLEHEKTTSMQAFSHLSANGVSAACWSIRRPPRGANNFALFVWRLQLGGRPSDGAEKTDSMKQIRFCKVSIVGGQTSSY